MNKPNWKICIIFLLVIILSLFIGMKYIRKEGMADFSTTPNINMQPVLEDSEKALSNAKAALNTVNKKNETILFAQEVENATQVALNKRYDEVNADFYIKKAELVNSIFLNAIVCLKLYKDANNSAPLTTPPLYDRIAMNNTVNGDPTNLSYTVHNGRKCIKFNNDKNNYISFPILLFPNYSFCFWIYLNDSSRDNEYYTVASVTNAPGMNPGVQVDIKGLKVWVYSALPGGGEMVVVLEYTAPKEGWYHITYTYNSNAKNLSNPKNKYLAKLYVNGVDTARQGQSSPYGTGDLMANRKRRDRPNRFVLGRSGDDSRAFNGYVSDFNYYGITLPVEDISNDNTSTVKYVYNNTMLQA